MPGPRGKARRGPIGQRDGVAEARRKVLQQKIMSYLSIPGDGPPPTHRSIGR